MAAADSDFADDVIDIRRGAADTVQRRAVTPDAVAATVCARAGHTPSEDEWREHLPDLPYEDVCPRAG
ncbi:hypothetical protein ACQP25_43520 [Microtetraspora malaysiensis]|uniref:hypothetical protein n=1 Tax=Microtetraspora malaysiensis TaxID=161358 RepID=UPI003D93D3F8